MYSLGKSHLSTTQKININLKSKLYITVMENYYNAIPCEYAKNHKCTINGKVVMFFSSY